VEPLAYTSGQGGVDVDGEVVGVGAHRDQVPGQRASGGPEVQRADPGAGRHQRLDHRGHPAQVLEVQPHRVVEVQV
jgi:hypothetical protein